MIIQHRQMPSPLFCNFILFYYYYFFKRNQDVKRGKMGGGMYCSKSLQHIYKIQEVARDAKLQNLLFAFTPTSNIKIPIFFFQYKALFAIINYNMFTPAAKL